MPYPLFGILTAPKAHLSMYVVVLKFHPVDSDYPGRSNFQYCV